MEFNDVCSICIEEIKSPITLKCEHTFCRDCILDYKKTLDINKQLGINPCLYGAPRCPCTNENSCLNRPCCTRDNEIMRNWELNDPYQYREWTIDESTSHFNSTFINQNLSCPLCRQEFEI